MKTALITGVTGQDGSYLSELLLSKGYEVHGLIRRHSRYDLNNIEHIKDKLILHYGDLENENHLCSLVAELKLDELYNLAAQSDVRLSFDIPEYTGNATGLGVTRLLEAVRKFSPSTRLLQASSSEMFGDTLPPQSEASPFNPQNPYAAAKLYAFNMCRIYRKAYGLFIANSICFNHESERRGLNFVTRKITNGVAQIVAGKIKTLGLGNLDAKRDWGYAPEYVEAMWQMVNYEKPEDFVIATGETHTVRDFVEAAFASCELDWQKYVVLDKNALRPSETHYLLGDIRKVVTELGWRPKVTFRRLVAKMVEYDLRLAGIKEAVTVK